MEILKHTEALKRIRLFLTDVDGVLTNGQIALVPQQGWTRTFHVKDGYGLKMLMKAGIQTGFLSGGQSQDVQARGEFLKVDHLYLGSEDKLTVFEKIKSQSGFEDSQIAYIGDELFDIPVLQRVGFSATVPNAPPQVLAICSYVTTVGGGAGAVRELTDAILLAQGKFPNA